MYLWQTRSSIDQSSLMLLNMPWCMEFLSTRLAMLLQSCWKSLRQECKAFLSSLSTGWKIGNVNSKMTCSEAMHGHHIHRSSRPWNMTVWHKFCAFCKCMYKKIIRIIPKTHVPFGFSATRPQFSFFAIYNPSNLAHSHNLHHFCLAQAWTKINPHWPRIPTNCCQFFVPKNCGKPNTEQIALLMPWLTWDNCPIFQLSLGCIWSCGNEIKWTMI